MSSWDQYLLDVSEEYLASSKQVGNHFKLPIQLLLYLIMTLDIVSIC